MLRTTAARSIAALTIAVFATFGLAACTGAPAGGSPGSAAASPGAADAPGDEGQSTAEACDLVQQTISDATDEFESAASDDPTQVVESMKSAAEKLAAVSSTVTNDQVSALLPSLQEMFDKTAEVMQAVVDGDVSKAGDLSQLGTDFQATSEKFQEICTP